MSDELLKKWDRYLNLHYSNPRTKYIYYSVVRNFLNNVNKNDIKFDDILEFSQHTPQTNKCVILKIFANEILKIDTGKCPRKEKIRKKIAKSLTVDQIKELIDKVDNEDVKLMILIQYESGCRIGSVLNIKKRDVSVDADGFVKISMLEKGGRIVSRYITKETGSMLLNKIKNIKKNDLVFNINRKDRYHWVWEQLKKIDDIVTTHWFRHSRIMHLFEKGYDILEIQRITGHKSLEALKAYLLEAGADNKEIIMKEGGL